MCDFTIVESCPDLGSVSMVPAVLAYLQEGKERGLRGYSSAAKGAIQVHMVTFHFTRPE